MNDSTASAQNPPGQKVNEMDGKSTTETNVTANTGSGSGSGSGSEVRQNLLQRFAMTRAQPSEEGYETASHASTSSLASLTPNNRHRVSDLAKPVSAVAQNHATPIQAASPSPSPCSAAASQCQTHSTVVAMATQVQSRGTAPMLRMSSSGAVVNIAVRNEEGQPDFVEIDTADDEEEEDNGEIMPLEDIVRRLETSEKLRAAAAAAAAGHGAAQPTAEDEQTEIDGQEYLMRMSKIRRQSIAERVLKRRNSEHALQQAMQAADSRRAVLAQLLQEHQQLVKEVEKWSSLVSLKDKLDQSASSSRVRLSICANLEVESVDESLENMLCKDGEHA